MVLFNTWGVVLGAKQYEKPCSSVWGREWRVR